MPAIRFVNDADDPNAMEVSITATGRHRTRYVDSPAGNACTDVKQFAPSSPVTEILIMKTSQTVLRGVASVALAVSIALVAAPASAHRNDGPSAVSAVSALPIASVASAVVVGVGASAGAASVPVALSAGGARLVVRSLEVTARGTLCVLERVSDGATATVELSGRTLERGSLAVGRSVEVGVSAAGVVLSAAGEVVAFIPSELGRSLMHNERITY